MPTGESPRLRASRVRASAAPRPRVCGTEASAIVHPSSPAGQSTIPPGPVPGAGSVLEDGTVAKPPVAVTTRARSSLPPVAAMAAAAPATAMPSATIVRTTQPRPGSLAGPNWLVRRRRAPHSRQYSCPGTAVAPQCGQRVTFGGPAYSPPWAVGAPPTGRPQVAQNRAPSSRGAPQMQTVPPPPRTSEEPFNSESISCTRASMATSSAQRSTTSPALNRSRLYISSASPPRSRRRSSRIRSSAFRSRLSSRAGGAAYDGPGKRGASSSFFRRLGTRLR
jgi:hypothetical protein